MLSHRPPPQPPTAQAWHIPYERPPGAHDLRGYRTDLLLPTEAAVVELRGPAQYCDVDGREAVCGAAILKARLLRALGYRVMEVPLAEWEGLHTAEAREAYLRRRLWNE